MNNKPMMAKPAPKPMMKDEEIPAEIKDKMQQMKNDKAYGAGEKARKQSMGMTFAKGGKIDGCAQRGKTRGKNY